MDKISRMPIRELPIGQKLLRLLVLAGSTVLGVAVVVVTLYEATSFKHRLLRRAQAQAESFSPHLHNALKLQQGREARKLLPTLDIEPSLRAACVYLVDRSEFARFSRLPPQETSSICPRLATDPTNRFENGSLIFFHRIVSPEGTQGTLYLNYDAPSFPRRMFSYLPLFAGLSLALFAFALLLFTVLRWAVSEPIRKLAQRARRTIDQEDWNARLAEDGGDELGHLGSEFNRLFAQIEQRDSTIRRAHREQSELQEQLVQAQKMESIGRLVGGVAHDFNNLLTVMAGCTELVRYQFAESNENNSAKSLLQNIQDATRQATALTHQLLAFARRQIIGPRVLSLNELVLDAEKMLRSMISEDIELVVIPRPDLWLVKADPSQMMQVLVNLVINARDAMPQGGTLTIETQNHTLTPEDLEGRDEVAPGDYSMLSVRDTGTGLSEEAQARLFEPFFTTKERGKGTGLGLAMCYGILKQSGGHIKFSSELEQGTRFDVFLRRDHAAQEVSKPKSLPLDLPSGEETILVVEDAALVRVTTAELLRAQGYTVLEAASGSDALHLVKEGDEEIHLLLTDVVMPEMSGPDVARQITGLRPGIRVLYISGYTAREIGHRSELDPGVAFLQKPFTSETLIRKVRQTIDTP